MHDYHHLRVYDMAIEITTETYRLTKTLGGVLAVTLPDLCAS